MSSKGDDVKTDDIAGANYGVGLGIAGRDVAQSRTGHGPGLNLNATDTLHPQLQDTT